MASAVMPDDLQPSHPVSCPTSIFFPLLSQQLSRTPFNGAPSKFEAHLNDVLARPSSANEHGSLLDRLLTTDRRRSPSPSRRTYLGPDVVFHQERAPCTCKEVQYIARPLLRLFFCSRQKRDTSELDHEREAKARVTDSFIDLKKLQESRVIVCC